jgi:dolichol-phosphate mannosyltransferase
VRALVIVPTYNERDNLPVLAAQVLAHDGVDLMIVDDGSPDGTGVVADAIASEQEGRVLVVHRQGPRGLGRSYVQGMQRALRITDAPLICQMDADLPRLLGAADRADLSIGSRYVPGGTVVNWPASRVVLSTFANRYVRLLTGLGVHDVTSGFRCWRRELLRLMPLATLASDGYAFQVEMTWHAHRLGGRITEVPITFVERRRGQSKLTGQVILESVLLPWRLAARRLPGTSARCTLWGI